MNPYLVLASAIGGEAMALGARLSAWHDAMVAHERVLRLGHRECEDDCPHVEAASLWQEALQTFGERAHELTFLRTRAARRARAPFHLAAAGG